MCFSVSRVVIRVTPSSSTNLEVEIETRPRKFPSPQRLTSSCSWGGRQSWSGLVGPGPPINADNRAGQIHRKFFKFRYQNLQLLPYDQ